MGKVLGKFLDGKYTYVIVYLQGIIKSKLQYNQVNKMLIRNGKKNKRRY
jgi:hypothetical protein